MEANQNIFIVTIANSDKLVDSMESFQWFVRKEQKLRLPDCFYVSGHLVNDLFLIATEFNDIFLNVGSKLAQQFSPTNDFKNYLNKNILSRFEFSHVTNQQVTNIVMSFKNSSPIQRKR